ncbi:MAG: hypothetical protein IJA41_01220 [Clostridia bacterium]|nr:hypothetical protein [Clostridia bacterium]
MSVGRYLIAGLKVEMNVRGEMLRERSEKYRSDFEGEPDIVIDPEPEKLARLQEDFPRLKEDAVEYLGTGCIFYYRLLKFDGLMLHSSCIAYDGKAYIFSADSGTGKSTHTSLWREYIDGVTMINDDKPAIRLIDGVFYAIGTPWSGKTDQNTDIAVPVGGVALLKRGLENRITPAKPAEIVPFIMRQTMFPTKPENIDRLADLLDKFIRTVPIYDLECDISERAVITSFEALTKSKYVKRK